MCARCGDDDDTRSYTLISTAHDAVSQFRGKFADTATQAMGCEIATILEAKQYRLRTGVSSYDDMAIGALAREREFRANGDGKHTVGATRYRGNHKQMRSNGRSRNN